MQPLCRMLFALFAAAGTIGFGKGKSGWLATAAPDAPKATTTPSKIVRARMPFLESGDGHPERRRKGQQNTGQQQQQLWMYEGALYDPLDGRRVASVQGLELVRPLEDTANLAIESVLSHPNATYQDARTLWSQKIFCYTKPTTTEDSEMIQKGNQRESLLRSVRVRPRSPRKEVPMDQAVAVYETATTFVSRSSEAGDADDDGELLVHSEWPNGQTIWGSASKGASNPSGSMEYTVFAKLRNRHSPLYAPNLVPDEDVEKSRTRDGETIVSPKRAALVQFGSSDKTMESKHKYGARETYSYRNIATPAPDTGRNRWPSFPWNRPGGNEHKDGRAPATSVRYSRYGEGPPFYAPGRMCMLELEGRPIRDLREATPLLRGLLKEGGGPVANFHYRSDTGGGADAAGGGDRNGKQPPKKAGGSMPAETAPSIQTAWNRTGKSGKYSAKRNGPRRSVGAGKLLLRLEAPEDGCDGFGASPSTGGRSLRAWTKRGMQRAEGVWDRLKAATSMEEKS